MFKELLEATNYALGVTREVESCTVEIKRQADEISRLRGEVDALMLKMERMAFDIEKMRDQSQNERTVLLLQLENAMLKFERRLPSTNDERLSG